MFRSLEEVRTIVFSWGDLRGLGGGVWWRCELGLEVRFSLSF